MLDSYTVEISSNILVSENKIGSIMVNELVLFVHNSFNINCFYRRSFLDKNLEEVTIDLPIDIDSKELMEIINNVKNENSYIRETWDIEHFYNCYAIDIENDDNTYDVPKNSELGLRIANIFNLDLYLTYSNQDIINMINI